MKIAFLAFDGVEELDLVGPWEVFALLERMGEPLERSIIGLREGLVTAGGGMRLAVDAAWDRVPQPDWLIIPGGAAVRPEPPAELVDVVRRLAPRSKLLASVCTGTFLLGEAGLLDGRKVTTNHGWRDVLRERYPKARVLDDDLVVEPPLWTAGAIASGIPLALALVAHHWSERQAEEIARRMNYRGMA